MDLPNNWEQCETEHNRQYDPYDSIGCPECGYINYSFMESDHCVDCGEPLNE